jgi:general secretion pathway protein I
MTSNRNTYSGSKKPTRRQHGFTLLETLVAMMILSIALVIIFQQFSGALNAGHISESYSRAVMHAREKMDELLLQETLSPESREGEFGDGYRWQYRIAPADIDSPLDPEGPAFFSITVWVSWQQGRHTKQMDISTLALSGSPEV